MHPAAIHAAHVLHHSSGIGSGLLGAAIVCCVVFAARALIRAARALGRGE